MNSSFHVTDAEWQIMRVLWEKQTCTAVDVTETLHNSKQWSPTTVKTFLSRLVGKNLVRYEKNGKTYYYSSLVSEQACVISEMKAVLSRVYGGTIHYETDHFRFFGMEDRPLFRRLSDRLEQSFANLDKDFGIHLEEKQMVYLYSSKNRLHSALGLQVGPQWLRAGWKWDILHIAPEAEFTDLPIESATVHVWMQRMINEINPDAPYWLQQGIATHESGWLSPERFEAAMIQIRDSIGPQTVVNLNRKFDVFRWQFGYELTDTVIEFILREFGRPALVSFLLHPHDYESVFSCDSTQFWIRWVDFVQNQFIDKKEENK